MTEQELLRGAYNAHEWAEQAALEAMYAKLREQSIDALACLADPTWRWETRSWISPAIIDYASAVLNEKLEMALAV